MVVNANELDVRWKHVLEELSIGDPVIVEQDGKPMGAMIAYEDFLALQAQLEDLADLRSARIAIAEYNRNPTRAHSVQEVIAELEARDSRPATDLDTGNCAIVD